MTRLKRLAAPRTWTIGRKEKRWAVTSSPGPHRRDASVPLIVVLRDMLRVCDNAREGERLVHGRKVLVDGRAVTDPRHAVGFMDVVSIPDSKQHYRVLIDRRGKLRLVPIEESNASWKLVRIENKTAASGGKLQLNLSDGRNILVDKGQYRTADTLKISLPEQKIVEVIPFEKGNVALLSGGAHVGEIGHLEEEKVERSAKPNVVRFKEGFNTVKPYVFVVGRAEPLVKLPEVSAV